MEAKPDEYSDSGKKSRTKILRTATVLTVLAVLLLGSLYVYLSYSGSGSPQKLFSDIHAADIPADPGLNAASLTPPGFAASMRSFREKKYEKALAGFTELAKTGRENDTLACYLGLAHLELKHADTAIFWLEKALSMGSGGIIQEKAEIYLGLAFVLKGDFSSANHSFRTIAANEQHTFHNEAIKAEARLLRYFEREEE
ncbi:MAG: hypothetical protein R3C61_11445 [Bacteroidia bacterium]